MDTTYSTKPVALFDIDKTMYDGFSYFALLKKLVADNLLPQATYDAALAGMQQYKTGKQSYEPTIAALLDIFARGLAGQSEQAVQAASLAFYKASDKFFAYVEPVIAQLQGSHHIAIITGEPQFVAEAVCQRFGIAEFQSSVYEVQDGMFTGRVSTYLAHRNEKHQAILHLLPESKAPGSAAFGDSIGDAEMLERVEHAFCIQPEPELRAIAEQQGWPILAPQDVEQKVTAALA